MNGHKPRPKQQISDLSATTPFNFDTIATRYQEIQKANPRLQKLLEKFSNDPERKLNSVYESVMCPANPSKADMEKYSHTKNSSCKRTNPPPINSEKLTRPFQIPRPKIGVSVKNDIGAIPKPSEIRGDAQKPKNFVLMNKIDAFDQHRFFSKNAQFQNFTSSEKN